MESFLKHYVSLFRTKSRVFVSLLVIISASLFLSWMVLVGHDSTQGLHRKHDWSKHYKARHSAVGNQSLAAEQVAVQRGAAYTRGGYRDDRTRNGSLGGGGGMVCDDCCYRYVPIIDGVIRELKGRDLERKGCRRRLPGALIIGVKKGGTTTLRNFLSYHPDLACTQTELRFFTSNELMSKGLKYYRSQMIHSTRSQIAIEKTPEYYSYTKVPYLIRRAIPNAKLIIILRDPLERAVSDYVHITVSLSSACNRAGGGGGGDDDDRGHGACNRTMNGSKYFIADTFDESVIDAAGRVRRDNLLIARGLYVNAIRRYLRHFRPEQLLAVDGDRFVVDPYPAVKRIERFLGVRDYFTREHFYFDEQKGFFCLTRPIPNNCMRSAKGRPHPVLEESTLRKVREYYRPYNDELSALLGRNFTFTRKY